MTPHRQVWEALSRCSTAGPLIPPSCKPSREGGGDQGDASGGWQTN